MRSIPPRMLCKEEFDKRIKYLKEKRLDVIFENIYPELMNPVKRSKVLIFCVCGSIPMLVMLTFLALIFLGATQ